MSKWPFALSDNNGNWTVDDILSHVRAELERWTWGCEGGTPAANAFLRQVSVDAAMVIVQESLKFVQNDPGSSGHGFSFEPGAEPTLIMWPMNLETLAVTVDFEAVMLHHDIYVHDREQMTDMAACLRRIADRYEQAAEEIDWAAVEADRYDGTARPFDDGTVKPRGPLDDFHDEMAKILAKEMFERFAADMPAPKS